MHTGSVYFVSFSEIVVWSIPTHSAVIAALAPSNIFAIAMMLLTRQSPIHIKCPDFPYRIRTISSNVWASGTLVLHAMPSTAKKTIIGEQL
jgi:hypothetical protein